MAEKTLQYTHAVSASWSVSTSVLAYELDVLVTFLCDWQALSGELSFMKQVLLKRGNNLLLSVCFSGIQTPSNIGLLSK